MSLSQPFPILFCRCLKQVLPAILCLNFGLAGASEAAVDRWIVCTRPALMKAQVPAIASRIAALVAEGDALIRVGGAPVGQGSLEFRLAATADIFERLREQLQALRIPHRRVAFEWLASVEVLAGRGPGPADCSRAEVLIKIMGEQP